MWKEIVAQKASPKYSIYVHKDKPMDKSVSKIMLSLVETKLKTLTLLRQNVSQETIKLVW